MRAAHANPGSIPRASDNALDFDKILVLGSGAGTCICLEEKCCLAANEEKFPIGIIKEDGFIVKCGLPCCTMGLKMPDTKDLISSEGRCLCCHSVAQFPFGDKVSKPVCAVCFLQCLPEVGCAKPGPGGAPPTGTTMER